MSIFICCKGQKQMQFEELKGLFGSEEAVLELVQLEDGALALRIANSEQAPLVRIDFREDLRKILGDDMGVIAQSMIHAAVFGVMEQQARRWHANVVETSPEVYS